MRIILSRKTPVFPFLCLTGKLWARFLLAIRSIGDLHCFPPFLFPFKRSITNWLGWDATLDCFYFLWGYRIKKTYYVSLELHSIDTPNNTLLIFLSGEVLCCSYVKNKTFFDSPSRVYSPFWLLLCINVSTTIANLLAYLCPCLMDYEQLPRALSGGSFRKLAFLNLLYFTLFLLHLSLCLVLLAYRIAQGGNNKIALKLPSLQGLTMPLYRRLKFIDASGLEWMARSNWVVSNDLGC